MLSKRVLDKANHTDVTSNQRCQSCPRNGLTLATILEVSVAICRVCNREDKLRKERCPACNRFWAKNGYERPDSLIAKAAHRFENRLDRFDILVEAEAMTKSAYIGPSVSVDCLCGCGHSADAGCDGMAKRCADLSWYRQQRLLTAS